jgi:hypothetical protein
MAIVWGDEKLSFIEVTTNNVNMKCGAYSIKINPRLTFVPFFAYFFSPTVASFKRQLPAIKRRTQNGPLCSRLNLNA